MILKLLSKTNGISLLVFSGFVSVELWGFFVGVEVFFGKEGGR